MKDDTASVEEDPPRRLSMIWNLPSGSAGQPAGPESRDKGHRGRLSDLAGRNVSET